MSMKFNEEKYTAALETIAQELINMVLDDYGQIDEDLPIIVSRTSPLSSQQDTC